MYQISFAIFYIDLQKIKTSTQVTLDPRQKNNKTEDTGDAGLKNKQTKDSENPEDILKIN